jgi:pilus assembly protein Flp/PilA
MKGIRMLTNFRKVVHGARDRGASAVEYGLMVAAIAAVIVGVVFALGGVVKGVFNTSCKQLSSPDGSVAGATARCP